MNKQQKTLTLKTLVGLALLALMTGCGGGNGQSLSLTNVWENRPRPLQHFFRGDACSTCSPAAGQPTNAGTNFAPGCESGNCGGSYPYPAEPQIYSGQPTDGVPYYPSDVPLGASGGNVNPQINLGYAPAYSAESGTSNLPNTIGSAIGLPELGQGLREIESPPMYGSTNF